MSTGCENFKDISPTSNKLLIKGTRCTQGLNEIQTHGLRKCISAAQCSTNSAKKTNTLGTGQFVEFILTNEKNKM